MKSGIFTANYVTYQVVTMPFNYQVERRFRDFYWLHSMLERDYPGYYIPPMAEKNNKRSFDSEHVKERMGDMLKFLESIAANKELRSSSFVLHFLKCKDIK